MLKHLSSFNLKHMQLLNYLNFLVSKMKIEVITNQWSVLSAKEIRAKQLSIKKITRKSCLACFSVLCNLTNFSCEGWPLNLAFILFHLFNTQQEEIQENKINYSKYKLLKCYLPVYEYFPLTLIFSKIQVV